MLLFSLSALAGDARVWCVGESTKIMATDAPQSNNLVWDASNQTATLGSARNEYVAFQIGVRAPEAGLKDVTVVPVDLTGPNGSISVSNMDLFVEHYMNVTVTSRGDATSIFPFCTTGEHPTQMVPFSARKFGAPFAIGANRNQPVWVDIYVPETATPGEYRGLFKVMTGNMQLAAVKVVLTVWNFTLPHVTHFRSFLYTSPENLQWAHRLGTNRDTPEWIAMEDAYFQMAHQHRLNFHPSQHDDMVKEIGRRYLKYYDGSGFTNRAGKGVGQNVVCMTPKTGDETAFKKTCVDIVKLYEDKKMTAMLFAYIMDEPHTPEDFATSKQRCQWAHQAVGNMLNTFIATPQWQSYDPGDVNIYAETKVADIPKVLERGDTVWAFHGGYAAGAYLDSPGFGGRSIAWMNWKMNLGGWQYWNCCYYVDREMRSHREGKKWVCNFTDDMIDREPEKYLEKLWDDPMNIDESRKKDYSLSDAIRINGDGLLFYPGYDVGIQGPIASFAMKSLRRGVQDYEYLWLLREAGRSTEIQLIVDGQCPAPKKWNEDVESWDKARLALAKLLNHAQ